jgi:serine/threonine protein kinase
MPLHGEAKRPTYTQLRPARGGTTMVMEAFHEGFGDWRVQKTVPIRAESIAFQEPRLLEQLDHPYIVEVSEAQYDPDRANHITFVMPLYAGGSVAHRLVDGYRFSIGQAAQLARNVLAALDHLHVEHGYVHRDMKGDNVLLDQRLAHGYLADMELAGAIESDGRASLAIGTYAYLAPECITTGRYGPEADLYGLGLILFEMLSGRFKWEHVDMDRVEQRVANGQRSLPDRLLAPAAFAPHIPDSVRTMVRRGLAKDPRARFSTAAQFIRAINRVQFIDWRHETGSGLDGTWAGTWPPQHSVTRRSTYRVESKILERGPSSGRRRLRASYANPGATNFRRLAGLPDRTVAPDDSEAVRSLFREVSARAAHRTPAR